MVLCEKCWFGVCFRSFIVLLVLGFSVAFIFFWSFFCFFRVIEVDLYLIRDV